jgi:predicted Zn-dependent protease
MHPRWHLSHARGYLELGLVEEAAAELAQLQPGQPDETEIMGLHALILREQSRWTELCVTASELTRRQPHLADWWITLAYATRRAVSLHEAEAILREAELRHPKEPTIQFNLGCYACQRGDVAEARRRVAAAVAIDAHFSAAAATDPDLAALRAIPATSPDCPPSA